MRLDTLITTETKEKLLSISYSLKQTTVDRQRALIKGEYYAQEIQKIRLMSKFELVKFIDELKKDKGVKLGKKIAHSSSTFMYMKLDSKIRQNIELINYARNRLYANI
jgi:hypothetical protein